MFKKIFKAFIPPIFVSIYNRIFSGDSLFGGESDLFCNALLNSTCYLEFGVGHSTTIVAKYDNILIAIGVDTSRFWVEQVRKSLYHPNKFQFFCIDLGELENWGTPKTYQYRSKFREYIDFASIRGISADLVLIDGRFRVATFLSCLKYLEKGTIIIFDDYVDRHRYHVVEEILQPEEKNNRQAKFIVPELNDYELKCIDALIEKFEYVMD